MISVKRSLLGRVFDLFTLRLLLEQIGLALLVFALFALWLRVPDASAMDVIGSLLLAFLVLGLAGAGESSLMLRLCGSPRTARRLARGAVILAVAAALWFGADALLTRLEMNNGLRAGYLNSRLPHSMRNLFSYARIFVWLGWIGIILRCIGAGVLALLAFAAVTSARPIRSVVRPLRSGAYWIAVLLGLPLAVALTGALLRWTPGHGVNAEIFSLIVRLGLVAVLDGALVSLLLAILALCVCEADLVYTTPAGTPDASQPRTSPIP